MRFPKKTTCFAALLAISAAMPAAADETTYELTLKNHQFDPASIKVPADKSFALHVKNLDESAEEFDSDDLGVEKVIAGGGEGTIHVHALKAGSYKFEGEYHEDTAHGMLTAE